MGCYGLGLSRILAASVEYLSSELPENIEIMTARKGGNTEEYSADSVGELPNQTLLKNNIISLRWPKLIVPFKFCIILPKEGSKEDRGKGREFALHLSQTFQERYGEDVLIDDRSNLTVGKRLLTAKAIGIPFVIVAGRNILEEKPKFELYFNGCDDSHMIETPAGSHSDSPSDRRDRPAPLYTQLELLNFVNQHLPQYRL